jgi:hypothetical protein
MATLPENFNLDSVYHNKYLLSQYKWQLIRDSLEGEVAIKAKNELYLPMPSAMLMAGASASSTQNTYGIRTPDYHTNAPYSAYKSRARFPEYTDATLRGIIGLILRNPSAYESIPGNIEKAATKDNQSLADLEIHLASEVMSLGRIGLLVDIDENTNSPKLVPYATETIINWRTKGNEENIEITSLLLEDTSDITDFWASDPGIRKHLLLIINDNGYYEVGHYENGRLVDSRIPEIFGKKLTKIPFVAIGTTDLTPDIDSAPLWPLANLSKNIYQCTADLRNAQFMSCNPMLTISGITKEQVPTAIGSSVALILEEYTSKAYYPKTDTSALDHVRMYIRDLQSEAVRMGANLLGTESTQAESGEAIRLRQSMSAATVASVVATVGKGLARALQFVADWIGASEQPVIKVNTEFSSFQMTANEQIALVQTWQAGVMSTETALENFRRAGMLQDGETPEDEIKRIQADTFKKELDVHKAALKNKSSDLNTGPKGANADGSLNLPEGSEMNPAVS